MLIIENGFSKYILKTSKTNANPIHIGLLCAMPEEIGTTLENLCSISEINFGDLKVISGEWSEAGDNFPSIYISVAWSGWGKVSAARAATRVLATSFRGKSIDLLIFTGVAGSAKESLNQWDIVLPTELVQHDMDARPMFEKFVIPALNKDRISSINEWVDWAFSSFKEAISKDVLKKFGRVEKGLIATGDQFITDQNLVETLSKDLVGLCAVEMEGAAVAQVACQENIPWLIVRVISDGADNSAAQTFKDFIKDYEKFSWKLIEVLLKKFMESPLNQ